MNGCTSITSIGGIKWTGFYHFLGWSIWTVCISRNQPIIFLNVMTGVTGFLVKSFVKFISNRQIHIASVILAIFEAIFVLKTDFLGEYVWIFRLIGDIKLFDFRLIGNKGKICFPIRRNTVSNVYIL